MNAAGFDRELQHTKVFGKTMNAAGFDRELQHTKVFGKTMNAEGFDRELQQRELQQRVSTRCDTQRVFGKTLRGSPMMKRGAVNAACILIHRSLVDGRRYPDRIVATRETLREL
jgi:hypothetical protein